MCDSVCGEKREKEPTSFSGLYFLSFQRCGIAGTLLYNILSISLAHTSTRTSTLAHFKGVKLPLKHKHVHIKIDTLCAVAFPMHTSLERKDGMRAFARTLSLSLSEKTVLPSIHFGGFSAARARSNPSLLVRQKLNLLGQLFGAQKCRRKKKKKKTKKPPIH